MAPRPDVVVAVPLGKRWAVPGGDETDEAITLHVVTGDAAARRGYEVTLRLEVADDGELTVSGPDVVEVPSS